MPLCNNKISLMRLRNDLRVLIRVNSTLPSPFPTNQKNVESKPVEEGRAQMGPHPLILASHDQSHRDHFFSDRSQNPSKGNYSLVDSPTATLGDANT